MLSCNSGMLHYCNNAAMLYWCLLEPYAPKSSSDSIIPDKLPNHRDYMLSTSVLGTEKEAEESPILPNETSSHRPHYLAPSSTHDTYHVHTHDAPDSEQVQRIIRQIDKSWMILKGFKADYLVASKSIIQNIGFNLQKGLAPSIIESFRRGLDLHEQLCHLGLPVTSQAIQASRLPFAEEAGFCFDLAKKHALATLDDFQAEESPAQRRSKGKKHVDCSLGSNIWELTPQVSQTPITRITPVTPAMPVRTTPTTTQTSPIGPPQLYNLPIRSLKKPGLDDGLDAVKEFKSSFPTGYEREDVSGQNLLCGLRALSRSVQLQFVNPTPTVDELHATATSDETKELEALYTIGDEVRSLENDYSADHPVVILQT